jgi:hypothetical protein
MPTINWSISGSTSDVSSSVSGTFVVTTTSNSVNTEIPTSITISSSKPGVSSFVPTNVQTYGGVGSNEYVTWRNTNTGQFPSSGISFDIWAASLASLVDLGDPWTTVLSTGTFSLETLKYTVFYNYNSPDAIWYGRGGSITFS